MGRLLVTNDNEDGDTVTGIYTFIVPEDRVYGDQVIASVFGLSLEAVTEGVPIAEVIRYVRDGDRQRLAKAMHDAILTGGFYKEEYQVVHPDGRQITVSAIGRCLRDAHGIPSIYSGVVTIVPQPAVVGIVEDPLELHCRAALCIAKGRSHALAARYLSSALSVLGGKTER
ncbi:MAG: PAS domain-containing protein [Rhizobiales bacterium]|nr:PAS domain-containing protein [Hyphomicrobiales bacterium]